MSSRDKARFSLQARFGLATMLSIISFIVIALILLFAFRQVRSNIGQIVDVQIQQSADSSHLARELGQFFPRLTFLEATFYGDDEFLQTEGAALLQIMERRQGHPHESELIQVLHEPFYERLKDYLAQCKVINDLLYRLGEEEKSLDETFVLAEEIVAERILETTLLGEQVDYYDQLTMQIAGYRFALLEIIQQNTQEKVQRPLVVDIQDLPVHMEKIDDLVLRLRPLAGSEKPINFLGRQLIDQLHYYQHLRNRFKQEKIYLSHRSVELGQLRQAVLTQMGELDQQYALAADQTRQDIEQIILSTGSIVWSLLGVLALILGLIQLNLYSFHIKRPMEKIRKRFFQFQEGDYKTPMALERSDEWAEIEALFNDMLTDLTKSWSAVQDSERRYRNIFDSASVGIYQSTIDGAFLNINPAIATMLGIDTYADLSLFTDLGKMIYADPEDRENFIRRLLQEENISNYEVKMKRNNGDVFWASINAHLVRNKSDEVQFIEGTVDDISSRHEAEKQLRKFKEYLHDIIDTMPSVLIGVNEALTVTLWNRQIAVQSGVAGGQAVGRPLDEVFTLIESAHYSKTVRETLKTGKVVRLRKIPGSDEAAGRFYDLLVYPLSAADAVGAVIHMDDVTEKVQIEEVMVQSEKMLSVGNLAAGMAHEINNPLASVLQNVQVMDQRLSPSLEKNRKVAEQLGITIEQVAEYARIRGFDQMIKSIAEAGQRAARIIENMLNFSRKSTSSFLPCSIADLAEKTIELAASDYDMKHHFDFRRIKVIRDYQETPDVPCESSQIQQVILNLLKNAAQAIGNDAENPEIYVRVFPLGEMVCLQVEDNGAGMDEATCRRIFEPFYTTKEVGRGTGLGLSVAYFLVTENHKGQLSVTSEPGRGSCFKLLLPRER